MNLADVISMEALGVLVLAAILLSLVILEAIDAGGIEDENPREASRQETGPRDRPRAVRG